MLKQWIHKYISLHSYGNFVLNGQLEHLKLIMIFYKNSEKKRIHYQNKQKAIHYYNNEEELITYLFIIFNTYIILFVINKLTN